MSEAWKPATTESLPIVPEKKERIAEILLSLQQQPAFSHQKEAYEAMQAAFETVEGKYRPHFESRFQEEGASNAIFKMHMNGIEHWIKNGAGARVGVVYSKKQYTFLGANGAIEIQEGDRSIPVVENPHNKIVFVKKGADGKGVWE